MPARARRPVRDSAPNLAPMVDVVMVILIFFMLGAGFAVREGALPSQLPADVGPGGAASVAATPLVRITLEEGPPPDGVRVRVMDQMLSDNDPAALYGFMRNKRDQGADTRGNVLIAADPGVRYKHVVAAFNACARAGYENVQFPLRTNAEPNGATTRP